MKNVMKRSILGKLIGKYPRVPVNTVAKQLNKVVMLQPRHHGNLSKQRQFPSLANIGNINTSNSIYRKEANLGKELIVRLLVRIKLFNSCRLLVS